MNIHPEAERLISDAIFKNGTATLVSDCVKLLSQAIRERDSLKDAADEVYNRLMPEVESLRAQVAAMREALEPFAEAAESLVNSDDDDAIIAPDFIQGSDLVVCTVSDIRLAHTALSTLKDQPNDH